MVMLVMTEEMLMTTKSEYDDDCADGDQDNDNDDEHDRDYSRW